MEDQKTSRGHPSRRGRTSREVCSWGDSGPLVVSWDTCACATRLTGHRSPPPSLYHVSLLLQHVLNPTIPCRGWILSRCLQSIFTYILTRVDWASVMRKVGCWNPEMQRWTEQNGWVNTFADITGIIPVLCQHLLCRLCGAVGADELVAGFSWSWEGKTNQMSGGKGWYQIGLSGHFPRFCWVFTTVYLSSRWSLRDTLPSATSLKSPGDTETCITLLGVQAQS